MKNILFVSIAATGICFASSAWALDFSADMISSTRGANVSGKIFVSNDKVRMETSGAITITRMDKNAAWVLMPEQKMYMEQKFDPKAIAASNEKIPGELSRELVGEENVDGRLAKKYRVTYTASALETVIFQCIDNATGIPVKTSAVDGSWSMEYRNLTVGAQSAALFEVPEGYQKFSMPNMADMARTIQGGSGEE